MIARALAALALAVVAVLLGAGASFADCPTPDGVPMDPAPTAAVLDPDTGAQCVRVVAEPSSSPTPTATPSAAPGQDSGVYVDPSTGSVKVDQGTFVGLGIAAWLASVCAGLGTARLVLP